MVHVDFVSKKYFQNIIILLDFINTYNQNEYSKLYLVHLIDIWKRLQFLCEWRKVLMLLNEQLLRWMRQGCMDFGTREFSKNFTESIVNSSKIPTNFAFQLGLHVEREY